MTHSFQHNPVRYFAEIGEYGEKLIAQGYANSGEDIVNLVDSYEDSTDETARSLSEALYRLGYNQQSLRYLGVQQ